MTPTDHLALLDEGPRGDRRMKQTDLKPCACCGKGVMHAGTPVFYRVKIESLCVNVEAARRQVGLEMMLGGNAAIAYHRGEGEPG